MVTLALKKAVTLKNSFVKEDPFKFIKKAVHNISDYTTRVFYLDERSALIAFRFLIFSLVALYLAQWQKELALAARSNLFLQRSLWFGLLLQAASNLWLISVPSRYFRQGITSAVFFLDALVISNVLFCASVQESNIFLVYFLVILMTVIVKRHTLPLLVAGFCGMLYAGIIVYNQSIFALLKSDVLIRFPLLGAVGLLAASFARYIKVKDELIDNISHELRTPLSSIRLASNSLLSEFHHKGNVLEGAKPDKILSVLDRSSDQMVRMVDSILESARSGQGRMELHKEPLSVEQMISQLTEEFEFPCQEQGITLIRDVKSSLPEVEADPALLRRALINLLSNAIKFTAPGGTITLSAELMKKNDPGFWKKDCGSVLQLSVTDNGLGIPKEMQKKIFRKYYQLSNLETSGKRGLGLGLAMVKSIVEAHQGSISVESVPQKGSTFSLQLPVDNN